jgi:hypothetical protein
MKTIAQKTRKRASVVRAHSQSGPNEKLTRVSRDFRFAPDAVGMMRGPADLSVRKSPSLPFLPVSSFCCFNFLPFSAVFAISGLTPSDRLHRPYDFLP